MKQYIKNSEIRNANQIIVIADGKQFLNPSEELILKDGWEIYVPIPYVPPIKLNPDEYEIQAALMLRIRKKQEASIMAEVETLSDDEALEVKALYPTWASFIGKEVKKGKRLYYNDKLYKVRQNHTVQEHQAPSTDNASQYEEVNEKAAGTKEDPIAYNNNMRLELGKFYSQNGAIYECTRDSEVAVYNDLKELVDIYVKTVK